MATVITRAFEHWQAGQVLNNLPARPDTIIFAHIPGLDHTADINPDEGIPADGQIVHRDVVAQYGLINDSAVAYSVVLDTRVGDFTFNWIGLVDAASNTLCMIVHTPAQQKIATANGVQGNNITRTFLMEFAGAAEASQITVSAQTWQIDFSARLRGIDEVSRLANLDYYGHAAFFSDGFSVSKDGDKYRVKAGLAYVGGIRALLADDVLLEAAAGNMVYADVSYQGSVLSEFAPIIHLGVKHSAGDFGDYTDANGFTHYIASLALITASGEEDKREANPFDKAIADINVALKEHETSRNHPDATLNAKGFTQLGSDIDSDSETLAATLKAVKKAVNAGVTAMSDHVRDENPHDQYLQIKNFLSEIKALGPGALAEVFVNLELGGAAKRNVGTGLNNVPDIGIADSRYKRMDYLPMLSRVWVSAEYTPVTGTPLVVTHGLTGIDVLHCKADVLLKCVGTDAGYSPGDFAAGWSIHSSANAATVAFPALSSTTIQTNTGAAGTGLLVNGKGGGGSYSAVLANWRYILRIFY